MKQELFVIIIFYMYILFKIYYKKNKKIVINKDYDIIYNQGGYYGFYQLGICHYIKNNFDFSILLASTVVRALRSYAEQL